jgi:hypothetical protein
VLTVAHVPLVTPAVDRGVILSALLQRGLTPATQTRQGALRTRYLSPPLRHVLSPPVMSPGEWSIDYGALRQAGRGEDPASAPPQ